MPELANARTAPVVMVFKVFSEKVQHPQATTENRQRRIEIITTSCRSPREPEGRRGSSNAVRAAAMGAFTKLRRSPEFVTNTELIEQLG